MVQKKELKTKYKPFIDWSRGWGDAMDAIHPLVVDFEQDSQD